MSDSTDNQQETTGTPAAASLRLVVGYDGSSPASRALDAAAGMLRGRDGGIEVVYVAHVPGVDMLSATALGQIKSDFDEIEQELRAAVAAQLSASGVAWEFERRQGLVAESLIEAASAVSEAHPDETVTIVVGSSSHASHRVVGSVAVSLARHCPVPLMIVP